jgi:hypothetical protein
VLVLVLVLGNLESPDYEHENGVDSRLEASRLPRLARSAKNRLKTKIRAHNPTSHSP